LINKKSAYVCTCKNEIFKKLINSKKPCPCRDLTIRENLEKWKKMLDFKGFKEGKAVLRFKSNINDPNPALRDFPLARINTKTHPKLGNRYRVWPLMNLSVAIDDLEYKMTHIIRGKDHKDNALRQQMIYKALGKEDEYPFVLFIGRIKFTDVILSKRKIKSAIEEGNYEGWEDVRLPTLVSLRKRGYQKEAFEKFVIQRGISEVDKVISQKDLFKIINNFNREILKEKTRKVDFIPSKEKNSDIIILMPDNKKIFAKTNIKPKEDEIVYFEKFGYAKYNGILDNKALFWFCHD
jgi:glutamyl-tRNA synthetase